MQSGIVIELVGWSLQCGRVGRYWKFVWGSVCTLRCAVCGIAAWSLFQDGLSPQWVTRRLSWVVVVVRSVGRGAPQGSESVEVLSPVSLV